MNKFGWVARPREVEKIASRQHIPLFANFLKNSGKGKTIVLWPYIEKCSGLPFKSRNQEIGDCVSHSSALTVDLVKAVQSVLLKTNESWIEETATEPIYWLSRCEVGKFAIRGQDGSVGAWAAEAVKIYGTLVRNKYGSIDLSTYSGKNAKLYADKGCPDDLEKIAKEHPIQSVSLISTYEDVRDAIANGYPVSVCSNQGFDNVRDKDGFARPKGNWGHAMTVAGVRDDNRPGVLIQNSWGPSWISGPKVLQPEGSFWVDADVFERNMLKAGDSWVYSNFVGYPPQKLNWRML